MQTRQYRSSVVARRFPLLLPLMLGISAAFGIALQAHAVDGAIPIANPGFENPTLLPETFGASNAIPGWSGTSSQPFSFGVSRPPASLLTNREGSNVGVLKVGSIFQVTSASLQAGTLYTLTVDVGGFGDLAYQVDLLAGSSLLARDDNALQFQIDQLQTSTVSFLAGATDPSLGQALQVRLTTLGGSVFADAQIDFDRVTLTAASIPEPSTYGLLFAGLCLLAMARRGRCERSGT